MNRKINDGLTRQQRYYNTLRGSSFRLLHNYNRYDKEAGRPQGDLTVEWIMQERLKGCTYKDRCGVTDWKKVGLNRKDNSLPHTKDNCEPCCKECNEKLLYIFLKERRGTNVDQIDLETGEIINSYSSISEAAKKTGANVSDICSCCNGGYFDKRKNKWINYTQHMGYLWRSYHK